MLEKISTKGDDGLNKEETQLQNEALIEQIADLQKIMYAGAEKSILIIVQGVDAAGKDGVITALTNKMNPFGFQLHAFKKPTTEEYAHDFLWRVHSKVPSKGMIHIFNRSHYEDILVPSVEGYIDKKIIKERMKHINNFESLLETNGTTILKFYMHVSKEKAMERLQERTTNPHKFWKHNDSDWSSHKKWDDYMKVYEQIFKKCNDIPWHIVPADKNWVKTNYIAKVILKTLQDFDLKWPALDSNKF